MEIFTLWWLIFIFSLGLCIFPTFTFLFNFISQNSNIIKNNKNKKLPLPPGPSTLSVLKIFIKFLWQKMASFDMEPTLYELKLKYGPLFTLKLKSRSNIFIASPSLAHLALIHKGALFSDRPTTAVDLATAKIFKNSNAHGITTATYSQTWRILRRNLISEMLQPSCIKSYSRARSLVVENLIQRLLTLSLSRQPIKVMDHLPNAMLSLFIFMCFGVKLDEDKIREIKVMQRKWLSGVVRGVNLFILWPKLAEIFIGKQWNKLAELRKDQESIFKPLIHARINANKLEWKTHEEEEESVAYVDTLVDLQLPEEMRKLNESEIVSLCGEFLNTGTDTTTTSLIWIMANLVKYPEIQEKLYEEIAGVLGKPQTLIRVVKEGNLAKMPYLKATVLEGLRRHPPSHFLLPHSVTEEHVELEGFIIPKNANVNVMVAQIGLDPKIWEDPMEFKPERFLDSKTDDDIGGQLLDITGSREIKMMPFGVGRRICPAYGLAIFLLEYFVANLIWNFEWKAVDGVGVDLSEKQDFLVIMKNPLCANISPRF